MGKDLFKSSVKLRRKSVKMMKNMFIRYLDSLDEKFLD